MSKVCGVVNGCRFKPEQSTAGCPCAELCPSFVEDNMVNRYTNAIKPEHTLSVPDAIDRTKPENWCVDKLTGRIVK